MVNLRKADYGPFANKAVNLVAIFYNSSFTRDKDSGEVKDVYLDNRLHPDDRRAWSQPTLALMTTRNSTSNRVNYKTRFTRKQATEIRKAAGDNKAPVLNVKGEQIGVAFGYQADVVFTSTGIVPDISTVRPSGLSVKPVNGKTIQDQIFEKQANNKARRQANRMQQSRYPKDSPLKPQSQFLRKDPQME